MGIQKCPECGAPMQEIYGTKYETYYECIECGYGELREKSEYNSDDYYDDIEGYNELDEEFDELDIDDYKEYEEDELDF